MVQWVRWVVVALALSLSGCTLLQVNLTIDQAVARLVPADPLGVSNPDHFIGNQEMDLATQLWVSSRPVPGTGGQYITEDVLKQLIHLWQQAAPIP